MDLIKNGLPDLIKNSKEEANPPSFPNTVPWTLSKTVPWTLPKTVPWTLSKTVLWTLPKTVPWTLPRAVPATWSKTVPVTLSKAVLWTLPKTVPVTLSKTVPVTLSKSVLWTLPKPVPRTLPKTVPATLSKTVLVTSPKMVPVTLSKTVPWTLPKTVPRTSSKRTRVVLPGPGLRAIPAILGSKHRKYTSSGPTATWAHLLTAAQTTTQGHVAPETARTRANILSLFARFARQHHPQHDTTLCEASVLAFLQAMVNERGTGGSLAGVANYGRFLAATLRKSGHTALELAKFLRALNNRGAVVPMFQATPITRTQLLSLKARLSPQIWLATWLAWKSASRIGEVVALRGANIIAGAGTTFVVNWLQTTKAGKTRPFALCNLTEVVCGPHEADELRAILALSPDQPLCPMTTTTMVRHFRAAGLADITGHSLKRGAIRLLHQLAANGVVDPTVIPRLAKHRETAPLLPDMTVRYGADKVALARIGRTGELTRHL